MKAGDGAAAGEVTLNEVTRRFGDQIVLDGLSLTLAPGRVTALMGPNASGKTTVARLVLGLDRPDDGRVVGRHGLRCAAVFQEDRLCEHLSAAENVALVLEHPNRAAVAKELGAVGLDAEAIARPVRELSGGQRRRVAIARALSGDADLIVLDEPFTGIDVETKPELIAYVRGRLGGRTMLLITHDRSEATQLKAKVVRLGG